MFAFFQGSASILKAASYTWNGAVSTEWGNSSNWSPPGVPGALDNVTINTAVSNQPVWEENPGIKNLTISNGNLNLAGFSLSVTGTCIFSGGIVSNGTLILNGTSVTFSGTTFNANVQYTGNRFLLNGSTFNGSVSLAKTGGVNDVCTGGNTFNSSVVISNSDNNYVYLANTTADVFNQTVNFINLSTGGIYPARLAADTEFNGTITVNSTNTGGVRFGQGGGTSTLAAGKTLVIGGNGFTNGELNIRGLTQLGNAPVILSGSASGRVRFEPNTTFGGKVTCTFPLIHFSGSTFNDTLRATKTGSGNISGNGGCTFNGPVYIIKSAAGNLMLADLSPDIFMSDLYLDDNSGTGSIMLSRSAAGNQYNGDIYVNMNAAGINFGNNGGTSTLASGKTIRLWNDGCTAGTLGFRMFTQLGTTPVLITQTTGTATFAFQSTSTFNAPVTLQFPNITLQQTTFNQAVVLTKMSNSANSSYGGNIFNAALQLNVMGNGAFTMSNNLGDDYWGDLTIDNNSTNGTVNFCSVGADNLINGNLYLNNTSSGGIGFGQ